jgi:GTPase
MTQGINREVLPDGTVRITAGEAAFVFVRPVPTVLVVTITGYDKGQFATSPLDEISAVLRVATRVHLFVDARNAVGATVRVSEDWTGFLSRHRAELEHVHVLAAIFEAQLEAACKRRRQRPISARARRAARTSASAPLGRRCRLRR